MKTRGSVAVLRQRDLPAVRRDVRILMAAQSASTFGSFITRAALPLLAIIGLEISPEEAAFIAGVDLIAAAIASQIAGVWIDRLPRRPVMISADLLRALLLASIPLAAFVTGQVSLPHLILVSAASGACSSAFDIAERSYLAGLVPTPDLRSVLGRVLGIRGAAEFFGFGAAGLLVGSIGGPAAIGVDALTYVASALLLTALRVREPRLPKATARRGFLAEAEEGLRRTWAIPIMRPLIASSAAIGIYFGLFRSAYMIYVVRTLGLSPEVIGFIIASGGIASFVGGILTERVSLALGTGRAISASLVIVGIGLALVPLAPGASLAGIALLVAHQFLSDGFETVWEANQGAIRGRVLPDALQGRANAAFEGVSIIGRLIGIVAGGAIGGTVAGSGTALFCGAAASIAAGVVIGLTRLGRVQRISELPRALRGVA
ncbi:MAG: MFS transporter [Candidatus Limnocylindrus sp.]